MSVEVQWTDQDPETGVRRIISAERFARRWEFKVRYRRREDWFQPEVISLQMWQDLLEALERRVQRREGVSEEDLREVRKMITKLQSRPQADGDFVK